MKPLKTLQCKVFLWNSYFLCRALLAGPYMLLAVDVVQSMGPIELVNLTSEERVLEKS